MKTNVWKRTLSMVTVLCMLFSFAAVGSLVPTVAAETADYYSEDFENITELDWTPKNHSNATPSADDLAKVYASVVADPKDETNQVMKLNASAGASQCVGAVKELSSAPGIGVLKYKLYLGNNASYLCLPSFRYVANGSQGGWFFSVMANGNKLMLVLCQNAAVKQFVYTASEGLSDEWHDITLVQKTTAGKALDYAFYVDGVLVTEGQLNEENCEFITSANLAMTGISWSSYWSAAEAYIDDLSVTEYVPATGISVTDANSSTSADLGTGDTVQLSATVMPSNANHTEVTYSSSNEAVATVDANGKVTAIGGGTATITATVENCSVVGTAPLTATYEIAVSENYYSENFEEITELDWTPKNHSNATPSADDLAKVYASVVADPKDENNQVMKLNAGAGASQCVGAVKELSSAPGIGVLKYKLYLGNNASYLSLPSFRYVNNGSQGSWYFTIMANGNKLMLVLCQASSAKQFVYIASEGLSDEWHDITLVQKVANDPKTLDYALYVDDVLVTEGQLNEENCEFITSANLAMTGISWSSLWSAAEAYVDDLSVTEYVPATGVSVADTNGQNGAEVMLGDTVQLNASVKPASAGLVTITYTSSNDAVATVDANGMVTAVGTGNARITATLENCSAAGTAPLTAIYEVAVSATYYSENFEEITELDWIPKNHSNATPSDDDLAKVYASVVADPKDENNQVMKLNAGAGASQCVGAVKELSSAPGIGVLKYKLYLGNNASYLSLPSFRYVNNGSQGSWYFTIMANGNKLMLVLCQASSAKQFVYVASEGLSDEWHDITLVQKVANDPKTLDYALYVDDVLVTEGQLNEENCEFIASANLAMTGISWSSLWSAAEAYVDDLSVTEYATTNVPAYTVTYVADDVTVGEFIVYEGDSVPNVPAVPEKTGYTGAWDHDGTNITANTTITAVYTSAPSVDSYNLSLGDNIGMNFYVSVAEENAANTQVEIDVAGKSNTYDLSALNKDADGNYVVNVDLAAAQMTDTVTLKLMVNGEVIQSGEYTVLAYAETILSGEYSDTAKALVKEMLNYGAAAQTYFDYNTEKLANADIDLTDVGTADVPAEAETVMSVSGSVEGISYYGATLVFESKTAVRFYFNVTGDINSYSFNDGALKPVEKNGRWYVEIAGINPQNLNEAVTLKVACGDDVVTVTYAPLNYMVRMNVSGSDSLKALLKALYNYHKAAVAYTATESA